MSALLELAERCEKATGPDRALDYDIAHFVTRAHLASHGNAPAYAASLDAAVTLVPEGCKWGLYHDPDCKHPKGNSAAWVDNHFARYAAATPALALCAASLRARAAQGDQ